jgi:hypothetical protein
VTETLEHTARRIADRGRDALVARLRPAFEEAAAAHRDVLDLDDEQLEQMVQSAADRADGLQWRRALASVATEQLGIGLGEALSHPAVVRAQAIVGAPSYEDALGAVGAPVQPAEPAEPADEQPAGEEDGEAVEAEDGPEPEQPDEAEGAPVEEPLAEHVAPAADLAAGHIPKPAAAPEPEDAPETAGEAEPDGTADTGFYEGGDEAPAPAEGTWDDEGAHQPGELHLRAVHLGGIANLKPGERDIELQISDAGLDIVRGPERTPLGRLTWREISTLEVPEPSGRFRRRRASDANLVVRSEQGSASFEIPGITHEELQEHLAPLLADRP